MAANARKAASFKVYGPFLFDRDEIMDTKTRNQRWDAHDEKYPNLSRAHGVYVLSLANGKNYCPWYVGKTHKLGFRNEVFNAQNRNKVSHNLKDKKGKLVVHLLTKPKAKHKGFMSNIAGEKLHWLEVFMIFACRSKNTALLNKSHTKFIDSVEIAGITGDYSKGPSKNSINTLANAMKWW